MIKHHLLFMQILNVIEKIGKCKHLSSTKVSKHIPSGFLISTISLFRSIENKHGAYRGKYCVKKFFESLREHSIKITNFKKKIMKLLTKEQQESYENARIRYICKKN